MKLEELQAILALEPKEIVSKLQKTSFDDLPSWASLQKQYDPSKHSITDTTKYPAKLGNNNVDDFKRTTLALQKLAVNRVAQSMFSTPVTRIYNYDRESEKAAQAVALLEELYKTHVHIDSENIERCKKLNASCQIITLWSVVERPMVINGEQSKYTLKCKTYSEMDGFTLYPIVDENGDILVISISYKDSDDQEYFVMCANIPNQPILYIYTSGKQGYELLPENIKKLTAFPAVYINIPEPVWGGDSGTNKVEQLEEMESYQGLYIKRNAVPSFTLDMGELKVGSKKSTASTSSEDARRIITVGKGGSMQDVTWDGAAEAVDNRYQRIRNAFFEEIQVPDTSFANMIKSNTSAENKELVFADAKAKAEDLGGEWERLFYEEMRIVKEFAKVMFPSYAGEFDSISVRSIINPYSIKTKKEAAEYVSLAGGSMSLGTKVRILGEVDDVDEEIKQIQEQSSAETNQLI